MLRKKFGGPRVSAAKQVVALKPPAASVAAEEPTTAAKPSTTIAPHIDTNTLSSITPEVQTSPQKVSEDVNISPTLQTSMTTVTEKNKEVPAVINEDSVAVNNNKTPNNIDDSEDEEEAFIVPSMPAARVRTFSQTSMFSTTSTASVIKRKKREFEKDEELDAAKFTMADLIDWRPKTENTLRSKWKEAEKKFKEEGFTVKREKKEEETVGATEIGPKVKMDEDGNVIIDEESLVVRRNPENSVLETVDDDLMPKKLNSLSFKKNYSRTTNWSVIETELFYDILSATGTDFSLMQEYLPFKTRADLKKKFNKEEKVNMSRINATLSKPSILNDEVIKRRIEKYIDLIDKQKEEKLAAKMKKKKKTTENPTNSDPEVIEETDATQKSETVEPEASGPKKKRIPKAKAEKESKPKKASKKKSKKELTPIVTPSASEESVVAPAGPVTPPTVTTRSAARRENEEAAAALLTRPRNTRFGGLFEELGSDFPYFDIEEDDKIQVPSLKKMPEQFVILRVPTATQLKVMQKTKKSIYNRIGIITPNDIKYFVGISTDSENTKSLMLHKL
jgi:hypothetical protein